MCLATRWATTAVKLLNKLALTANYLHPQCENRVSFNHSLINRTTCKCTKIATLGNDVNSGRHRVHRSQHNTGEQPRQRNAKLQPDYPLVDSDNTSTSSARKQHKGGFLCAIRLSCCDNISLRFLEAVLWEATENKRQAATRRQAVMRVCLHRPSELASPLTGAATSERSQLTIEQSLCLFWQLPISIYLPLHIPNTGSEWVLMSNIMKAKLCFLAG